MTNETITQHLKQKNLEVNGDNTVKVGKHQLTFRLNEGQIFYVVHTPARANMLLAPESDYTREADKIGVSEESKIGRADFDERYVIRDPDNKAGDILSSDLIAAVEALEPFTELEMTTKQYRLLKKARDEAQVEKDLRALSKVVELSS